MCRSAADDADSSQAQLQLLLAELKRIEGQQQQLRTAAAEHKVLIVHPVKGFNLDAKDEYAEDEEAKPDPDRFVPSGQQHKGAWHTYQGCLSDPGLRGWQATSC